jgi:hypothetical protein
MKKAFRLLILSAVVIPVMTLTANAENPHAFQNQRHEAHNFFTDFFRDLFGGHAGANHRGNYGGGSNSQGDNGNGGNGGATAPIDGGISLLLAAGLGLGVKKAFNKNKAAKQQIAD